MKAKHILSGMISDGLSFPLRIPEYVRGLEKTLGLKGELDYSLDSVDKVDEAVRRLFTPIQRSEPRVFLPLIAYVTEVGRRQVNGRYEMRLGKDGITWEPWIVGRGESEYEFFALAYRELCDYSDETGSLRGALVGWVKADAFAPMIEPASTQLNESESPSQAGSYYEQLFQLISQNNPVDGEGGQGVRPIGKTRKSHKKRDDVRKKKRRKK
jgi:hypothetical protein